RRFVIEHLSENGFSRGNVREANMPALRFHVAQDISIGKARQRFALNAPALPYSLIIIMNWLVFALMTVASWGVYGVFLHTGQLGMKDAVNGRYKAFLFVGIAYFLTAVIAPLVVLLMRGA